MKKRNKTAIKAGFAALLAFSVFATIFTSNCAPKPADKTTTTTGTAPTVTYSGSPFTFTQNSAITTIAPTLTGDAPTSCSSSPTLPAGLSIAATTCAISGTPTAVSGVTAYTITATNATGNGTANISIAVNPPAAGTAYALSAGGVAFNMVYVPGGLTTPTGTTDGGTATVANAYTLAETEVALMPSMATATLGHPCPSNSITKRGG
ncbi:MAG: Ig domain-containing protein [Spirochaetia bacterium]|nr:Ig domain-containing protein [Spirochaetia bacterium]